jgi:hypothetical protein
MMQSMHDDIRQDGYLNINSIEVISVCQLGTLILNSEYSCAGVIDAGGTNETQLFIPFQFA